MPKFNFKIISLTLVGVFVFTGVFLGKEVKEASALLETKGSISCVHNDNNSITVNWAYENARQRPYLDIEWLEPSEGRWMQYQVAGLPWNPLPDSDGYNSDSRSGIYVDTYGGYNSPYRLRSDTDYTYHVRIGSACGVDIVASARCTRPGQQDPDPDPYQKATCNSVCMEKWGCPGKCEWKNIGCFGGCPSGMRDPQTSLSVCSWIFPCERCCCNCPAPSAEITCASQSQNSINLNVRVRGGYDDFYLYRDGVQITKLTRNQHGEYETVTFADSGLNLGQSYVYQVKSSASGWPNVGTAATCQTLSVPSSGFTIEPTCIERGNDYVIIGYRYANPPTGYLYLGYLQNKSFQRTIYLNSSQMTPRVWHEGSIRIDLTRQLVSNAKLDWQFYDRPCLSSRQAVSNSVECSLTGAGSYPATLSCLERGRNYVVIGYNYSNLPTSNPWLWEETTLVKKMIVAGKDASSSQRVEVSPTGRPMYWTLNDCSCPGRRVYYSDRIECTPGTHGTASPTDALPTSSISLSPGWNMISWPVTGSISSSTLAQQCGTGTIWGWSLASNNYYRADQITPGQGYWAKTDRACTIPASGTAWKGSVSLSGAGWHMVGAPSGGISLDDIGGNCQISSVWGWSPSAGQYIKPTRLEDGQGYWFRTAGSCTLNF